MTLQPLRLCMRVKVRTLKILMRGTADVCMCVLTSDIFRTHLFTFQMYHSSSRAGIKTNILSVAIIMAGLQFPPVCAYINKYMISIIEFLSNSNNYYPTHKALLCAVVTAGKKIQTSLRKGVEGKKYQLFTADAEFPLFCMQLLKIKMQLLTGRRVDLRKGIFFVSRALLFVVTSRGFPLFMQIFA